MLCSNRWTWLTLSLGGILLNLTAWAEDGPCACRQPAPPKGQALTVVVDLNAADLSRPLKPRHELAFQLEARPAARLKPAAPGGTVKVYLHTPAGREHLVASLHCDPESPNPQSARVSGYLYRQLFIWPQWSKASAGEYVARYQQDPRLQVKFRLP